MAPRVGKKFKTKAKKKSASSSTPIDFDRVRFPTAKNEDISKKLTKYRSIWGERQVVLDELDPSIRRNPEFRNWLFLCEVSDPPLAALIREFYWNLSIHLDDASGHRLTTWIRGENFQITKKVVNDALHVCLVHRPTFPYT